MTRPTRSAIGTTRLERFDFGVPYCPRTKLRRTLIRPALQSTSRQRSRLRVRGRGRPAAPRLRSAAPGYRAQPLLFDVRWGVIAPLVA